jgi:quercetin dioxygenase-like cupin family protein
MDIYPAGTGSAEGLPQGGVSASWLYGPAQDDTLDVALVSFVAGSATPPHIHHRGQTLVIVSGGGFVEVDGVRTEVCPSDIVVSPPGEQHVHGAVAGTAMTHLSVTTGRNEILGTPHTRHSDPSPEQPSS